MTSSLPEFAPALVQEIELSRSLPLLSAFDAQKNQMYQRTRCLVRLHTQPLGQIDFVFTTDELSPTVYIQDIWDAFGEQINAHLREDGLQEVAGLDVAGLSELQVPKCIEEREAFLLSAPFASVVISTRDRRDSLARCLQSLLLLQYPKYEVIVVDNVPSTNATFDLIQEVYADEPRIRYVREDRPGLSAGRNRGILEARGEIIAITDDDVVVDAYWLAAMAKSFRLAENVVCVTGLLLPMELETTAQFLLEAHGGFSEGFSRHIFDMREHRLKNPSYPYVAGAMSAGTGASMAFTARFLQQEGGFDPAMGTGTPTRGGEDLAIMLYAILHGNCLIYEPASLLYHQHHREYTALQRQLSGYGVAYTAYLTKILVDHPWLLFDCLLKCIRSVFVVLGNRRTKTAQIKGETGQYLQALGRLQRKGRPYGVLAYIQSRRSCGWTRTGLDLARESASAIKATNSVINQPKGFSIESVRN